ncbi:cobalamin-independent methionine synthase II family protein [Candidatus Rhodobacter oscarellae]|uniref:cobalamin-independent methionine synthase II family protein n=1 Tax=Candidatus Rhodobacter oscarellae TaxID=1675527 RepID=UPI001F1E96AB|nr:cobalamin-independent methionine synthase II family protein [Candidatus Rhodobacter lobularis]
MGSLPRPPDLLQMLEAAETGGKIDAAELEDRITQAICDIVEAQRAAGVDIVNDGENSKTSYTLYIQDRLNGVGPVPPEKERPKTAQHADLMEHPDLVELMASKTVGLSWFDRMAPPAAIGPVSYGDMAPLQRDLDNLTAVCEALGVQEAFMNSASPGVLTKFVPNMHYASEDAYIEALSEALRPEYEAITQAGFILQIDAPDLGSARHNQYQDLDEAAFLKIAARNVEALNHATRNIAPDRMRMHICWGNYEGPHTHDIAFASLHPVVMQARPAGLLIEGANPAHAHEYEDLKTLGLPDEKVLLPGVIDTTTNFVENHRLVAQRIEKWADAVGRERVIASTDCGFATFAGPNNPVAPTVVWSKLRALSQGAALASEALW